MLSWGQMLGNTGRSREANQEVPALTHALLVALEVGVAHCDLYLNALVLIFSPNTFPSSFHSGRGFLKGASSWLQGRNLLYQPEPSFGMSSVSLLASALMVSIESSSCQMLNQLAVSLIWDMQPLLFAWYDSLPLLSFSPKPRISPSAPPREWCGQVPRAAKSIVGSWDLKLFRSVPMAAIQCSLLELLCVQNLEVHLPSMSNRMLCTYCVQQFLSTITCFTSHNLYNIAMKEIIHLDLVTGFLNTFLNLWRGKLGIKRMNKRSQTTQLTRDEVKTWFQAILLRM